MANIEQQLSKISDSLRGKMNADEYKNYILGFIFYKYLSDSYKDYLNKYKVSMRFASIEEIVNSKDEYTDFKESALEKIGFYLEKGECCNEILEKGKTEIILEDLSNVFRSIEERTIGTASQSDFQGLFVDLDLMSSKLGETPEKRNKVVVSILSDLSEVDYELDSKDKDILGDAYEYLISNFAATAGKKGGEFYTPQEVSKLLSRIISIGKKEMASVYDTTCGSGSLLLQVRNYTNVKDLYGQELNPTTYNLARMNMLMHNVPFADFDIQKGDTLENPKHLDKKFEGIVANPPYSAHWNPDALRGDERFEGPGKMAPKTKADFAFVQHMLYQLEDNGTMAVVLPHGVLFRGSGELAIRKWLIENKNYLDAVIGLPANIFYGTSIPTVVLVFKKCREEDQGVLFIDSSAFFEKAKNKNIMREQDIEEIMRVYEGRYHVNKYSREVPLSEIAENDYNLNIPRYVDTFEEEEEIELSTVFEDLSILEKESKVIDTELGEFFKELGIDNE